MKSKRKLGRVIGIVAVVILAIAGFALTRSRQAATQTSEPYNPAIRPADFVPNVDNRYFPLVPGTTFVLRNKRSGETETMVVTNAKKTVMGVETTAVWYREVNKKNELVEETYDWYAQDKDGTVWYFGEETKSYKNGKLVSTAGSWEAGKNGALPGIIMKKNPQVGETWRQEYSKGTAEDMAQVLRTTESVTVPAGTYANCIRTKDWDSLRPFWDSLKPFKTEDKYYCPGAGIALEVASGGLSRTELVSIQLE